MTLGSFRDKDCLKEIAGEENCLAFDGNKKVIHDQISNLFKESVHRRIVSVRQFAKRLEMCAKLLKYLQRQTTNFNSMFFSCAEQGPDISVPYLNAVAKKIPDFDIALSPDFESFADYVRENGGICKTKEVERPLGKLKGAMKRIEELELRLQPCFSGGTENRA